MTRLAGEVADGWIAHELGSPDYLREVIMPNLEAGMQRSGRTRADLTVVASACCLPDADSGRARNHMAGLIAFYASVRSYTEFFAWHGFEKEAKVIQDRFRAGDIPAMLDAVTDEMVTTLSLAGTADEVREGLSRYRGIADVVKLTPPTHHVDDQVTRTAQAQILEIFAN